jgi:UDP-N-acetylmuramoylalanine-D-glutamate ligase
LHNAKLFGEHNRLNAIIARHIARAFDVPDPVSQQAIDTFVPLEHRMEVVAIKQSITFIDDAIGMTPESTAASLRAIHEKFGVIGCLLLGGQDRNYDFQDLLHLIASLHIPALVLFPDTIEKMKAAMPRDYHPRTLETKNMDEAVHFAVATAPQQSVVLLSTAAPSYSLWKDFEDKGNQFKEAVHSLPEKD